MGVTKEVWSKQPFRLVQDSFRIGSDLNESHWFRIGSAYVLCLQGTLVWSEDVQGTSVDPEEVRCYESNYFGDLDLLL